jgi:hypothetical protein
LAAGVTFLPPLSATPAQACESAPCGRLGGTLLTLGAGKPTSDLIHPFKHSVFNWDEKHPNSLESRFQAHQDG